MKLYNAITLGYGEGEEDVWAEQVRILSEIPLALMANCILRWVLLCFQLWWKPHMLCWAKLVLNLVLKEKKTKKLPKKKGGEIHKRLNRNSRDVPSGVVARGCLYDYESCLTA